MDSRTTSWAEHGARLADIPTSELRELEGGGLDFPLSHMRVDLGYQRVDAPLRRALAAELANAGLPSALRAMMRGEAVNASEGRAELHCALRQDPGETDDRGLPPAQLRALWEQRRPMLEVAEALRAGDPWWPDRPGGVRHLVHLGMGGSDAGARLVHGVFGDPEGLRLHFCSDLDPAPLRGLLSELPVSETLVVANSKSFGTRETLAMLGEARAWLCGALGEADGAGRILAVTADPGRVREQVGERVAVLEMPLDLCGRHSVWSASGLAAALALGEEGYRRLLAGARSADLDFLDLPMDANPAALAAAVDWHQARWQGADSRGLVVWDARLGSLPEYARQLEMESLGKGVSAAGGAPLEASGQVLWGGYGVTGQHSFMQMLHQGRRLLPLDQVLVETAGAEVLANAEAQIQALAHGHQGVADVPPWQRCPGNRPFGVLRLPDLQPENLGYLLAFWEHRVFAQALLYGLNPFDQWGVELAKDLLRKARGPAS